MFLEDGVQRFINQEIRTGDIKVLLAGKPVDVGLEKKNVSFAPHSTT